LAHIFFTEDLTFILSPNIKTIHNCSGRHRDTKSKKKVTTGDACGLRRACDELSLRRAQL